MKKPLHDCPDCYHEIEVCDECEGRGYVSEPVQWYEVSQEPLVTQSGGTSGMRSCPKGCAFPALFLAASV